MWDELKNYFRPEFLNRIDETVVFHALDAKNIEAIAEIQLKVLQARLAKMDLALDVSPAALAEIAKVGFDPVFGARPLKRAIQQRIENPLSKLLLDGTFGPEGHDPRRNGSDPEPRPVQLQPGRGTNGGRGGLNPDVQFPASCHLVHAGAGVCRQPRRRGAAARAPSGRLRYGWARLTGKPVTPWVMRFHPGQGFDRFRAAARPGEPTAADVAAARARGEVGDESGGADQAAMEAPTLPTCVPGRSTG